MSEAFMNRPAGMTAKRFRKLRHKRSLLVAAVFGIDQMLRRKPTKRYRKTVRQMIAASRGNDIAIGG